jgi:hypothetical protein
MSTRQNAIFEIGGLTKRKMAAALERAKRLGMTPQKYLQHLVEEDLAVSHRAKNSTFEHLLGPGREVDEAELDRLVEVARSSNQKPKSKRRG